MDLHFSLQSLVFFILQLCAALTLAQDDNKHEDFDVIPGGTPHGYEQTMGPFGCKFSYAAQGGTKEQWLMKLETQGENVVCSVEQTRGRSYLFFMNYKLQLTGATMQHGASESEPQKELKSDEYELDFPNNAVSSQDGKFQSQMCKTVVYGQRRAEKEL